MKLVNLLGTTIISVLFAVGCSSTDTTGDAGTTTDTGKAGDTGSSGETTPPADTAPGETAGETAGETGGDCASCLTAHCDAETKACAADAACKKRLDCMNACADAACQNKCISDNPTTKGDDLITCVLTNCKTECTK